MHATLLRWLTDRVAVRGDATDQVLPFQRSPTARPLSVETFDSPTVKQLVALEHETPRSSPPNAPPEVGLGISDQLVPFQRSMSVVNAPDFALKPPTAKQLAAFVQDTPCSAGDRVPLGLGLVVMLHRLPFQRSTSVFEAAAPATNRVPAARQDVGFVHAIASSWAPVAPVGPGTVTIDHVFPFQASTNARFAPATVWLPTAKQLVVLAHDTAASVLPISLGLAVTDQVLPFHCCTDAVAADWPTAKQRVAVGHDTPLSSLAEAPVGMAPVAPVALVDAAPVGVPGENAAPVASAIAAATASARPPMMPPVAPAPDAHLRPSCARRTPAYAPFRRRDRRVRRNACVVHAP